jgi:predicted double-glycine peptidase
MLELPFVPQSRPFTCGAACFESMVRYLRGTSPGELHWASELGTLELGYTPPENVVLLARRLGFECEMSEGASVPELRAAVDSGRVVFVTWWDEDAGHYSLVKTIERGEIVLMDPWVPRETQDNRMALDAFLPHWRARGARLIVAGNPAADRPVA